MSNLKFYRCSICGNLLEVVNDGGVTPVCCNQDMTLLKANSTDAAGEKHVPAVTRNGKDVTVQVGSVLHPMEDAHYIQWIIVEQGEHIQRINLKPGEEPIAKFTLKCDTEPIYVYEYCNLHGLWVAEA